MGRVSPQAVRPRLAEAPAERTWVEGLWPRPPGQFQFSDLALELVLVRAVSTARLAPCPVGGGRGGCEGTPAWVCLLQELSQSTCDSLEVRVPVWVRSLCCRRGSLAVHRWRLDACSLMALTVTAIL